MKIPEMERLIILFEEGTRLLAPYEINFKPGEKWSEDLAQMAQQLRTLSNPEELSEFIKRNDRGLFGGMGSLLDLCIHPDNGHVVADFREANHQLGLFRKRLFNIWQAFKQSLGLSDLPPK